MIVPDIKEAFDGNMVALTEQGKLVAAEAARRQQTADRNDRQNPVYAYAAQAANQASASLSRPVKKTEDKH